MTRIAVLFDCFGPYHFARLAGLRKAAVDWEVEGYQLRGASRDYQWRPQESDDVRTILRDRKEDASLFTRVQCIFAFLNERNPAALAIAGYARPEMLAALLWARLHRRPCVLLSETKADDFPRTGPREWIKSAIVRQFGAALVGGALHAAYLRQLGFRDDCVFIGYNIVGNEEYSPEKIRHLPAPVPSPYFLTINRFIEKKNLPRLLRAYRLYRDGAISRNHEVWPLVMCGDGPLRADLQALVSELGLKDMVCMPGFLQQAELLPYLAHAGVFIHASLVEQWGLVVNEAMAAGLPVIVSRACGCFPELVEDGANGAGFDPLDEIALANLMTGAAGGEWNLRSKGARSLERVAAYSPLRFGNGLLAAFKSAGLSPLSISDL